MNLLFLLRGPAALLLILTSSILSAQEGVEQLWDADRPNAIAAKVEGRIITVEQVRREMEPLLKQVSRISSNQQEYNANVTRLQRDVLQNLIDQILIVEDFRGRK